MQGELNEPNTLILRDRLFACYVYYFGHQASINISYYKNSSKLLLFLAWSIVFFMMLEHHDILNEKRTTEVVEAQRNNEIFVNHEINLKKLGETHRSSHYGTHVHLIQIFSFVINVIEYIVEDG